MFSAREPRHESVPGDVGFERAESLRADTIAVELRSRGDNFPEGMLSGGPRVPERYSQI